MFNQKHEQIIDELLPVIENQLDDLINPEVWHEIFSGVEMGVVKLGSFIRSEIVNINDQT